MSCCHRDTYRREALKAIGELAMVLPDDAYNRLDSICAVVKENLNPKKWGSWGPITNRKPGAVREALNCFTHMSCALKERFTDKIAKLCNDVAVLRGGEA